jgi:hypothetical protein
MGLIIAKGHRLTNFHRLLIVKQTSVLRVQTFIINLKHTSRQQLIDVDVTLLQVHIHHYKASYITDTALRRFLETTSYSNCITYGLFNDAVSSYKCMRSDGSMITE